MHFRHEWKHEISPGDLYALRARLSAVLDTDSHAVNGRYSVHSLYFDTSSDRALYEKINGFSHREKFRLRYYNHTPSPILLEKKLKQNNLCGKLQAPLSIEKAQALLNGTLSSAPDNPLLDELLRKRAWEGLCPKTAVLYTREAFLFAPGNVRVTLDYGLRTASSWREFLKPNSLSFPVPEAPAILEVKWDEFLPSLIRDLVQTPGTRTSAISKYAACHIYR